MSRTGNPSNQFPKSKGKLDEAEMEMDDLDEDQANVDDDGEEEFDDQDREGFQDLEEDDQQPPEQDSQADLSYQATRKASQIAGKPTGGPDLPRNPVSGGGKQLEVSNIRDDHMRGNPNNAPRQPTGSQDHLHPIQRPPQKTDLSKPPNSHSISDLADANRAFGKTGSPNQLSKADNQRGQSPLPPAGNSGSDQKKPLETVTYDTDPQFQKYLATLTEYDRSRYNQLLKKNVQLREELKKIADQTEALIKKERERKAGGAIVEKTEESEEVQAKMKILKQQQYHISTLKSKISQKRAELDSTQLLPQLRQKEDELHYLKMQLTRLLTEKKTAEALVVSQQRALANLKSPEDNEDKKTAILAELQETKAENKILLEKKQELEKEIKKNHSRLFDGKMYVRDLQKRIENHKKKFGTRDGEDGPRIITEADVEMMKDKVKELEEDRRMKVAMHERDLKEIESMKRELEKEQERLQLILAEKDREMRLNSLKLKELKRIQRTRAVKPIKKTFDIDDLNQEHELNKYLLRQERELKARAQVTDYANDYDDEPVAPQQKISLAIPQSGLKPSPSAPVVGSNLAALKSVDDINRKEQELLEQLKQLQAMKGNAMRK